ncbi:MAG: hypothetical protein WDA00_03390 [Eubacteriales bacterium]
MKQETQVLKELAKRVMEIARHPVQEERRELWRRHNSFVTTRPLIYVRTFAFHEILEKQSLHCEDPFYRGYEVKLREMMFRDTIGDDSIIEPWVTVDAVYDPPVELRWGVRTSLGEKPAAGGAAAFNPQLKTEEDFEKLVIPSHRINESVTRERAEKLCDAIGDTMDVHVNRGPAFLMWTGDISTDLAKLRGLEQIMWDAYDRPEWLHKVAAWMRDAILKVHEEAERAGDFSLVNHQNQAMPYAQELRDPKANAYGARRRELWGYMAAQEFTTFSPEMFDEFVLRYQLPILEKFGLVAYGCCEDLTHKIDYLRKIPNLRRIAVTPFANVPQCAEQIGREYIISWRPNPSSMISTGLNEEFVRGFMREHFRIFKAQRSQFDISLKDVETINHQPENVAKWVRIVREEIENCF